MADTTERVIRLDTIIAGAALLVSLVTAGALVYQTRVVEEQFAAANWPYLSIETNWTSTSYGIDVANNGAGPALIRSAQLALDGKTVGSWSPLFESAIRTAISQRQHVRFSIDSASIDASVTLRPGSTRSLISMSRAPASIVDAVCSHRVSLKLCYCSLTGTCWRVSDVAGSSVVDLPQPVQACEIGSTIQPANIK